MNKTRRPNTTRKPPVSSDSHTEIEDWMRRVMPDLNPMVIHLDKEIREMLPGLQYAIKWKKAYYGLPDLGWIIEMVAYDVSVNIVFLGGADFDSPPPLGDTDRSLYVKLKTPKRRRGRRSVIRSSRRNTCRAGSERSTGTARQPNAADGPRCGLPLNRSVGRYAVQPMSIFWSLVRLAGTGADRLESTYANIL